MGSITYDADFETAAARVSKERLSEVFATDPEYRMFGDPATYRNSWARVHVNGAMPPILILVAETEREQPPCLATGEEFATAARRRGACRGGSWNCPTAAT